jgi:tetratricopeptide (TPR) repeat protein
MAQPGAFHPAIPGRKTALCIWWWRCPVQPSGRTTNSREMFVSVLRTFQQVAVHTFWNKPTAMVIILLTGATLLTYGNSLLNGFVWDDHDIVVNNPLNRDHARIAEVFSSADSTISGNQDAYYRPLNRLTYMLEYQIFGLRPAGYHAGNIIIHLMTAILLYALALKLMGRAVPAFIAALLFVVHPVNAESVNFISARNGLLAAFFVLLTAISYLHAEAVHRKSYYYLSGLLFFLGLLCKEPALMLPIVLFLFGMTGVRTFSTGIKEKLLSYLPFALGAGVYAVLRTNALSSVIGGNRIADGLGERLLQNIYIIPKYVTIILFPLQLNALYSVPDDILAEAAWLVPIWLVLLAFILMLDRKKAVVRFGLLWVAINFIPISNIVPIPSAPMAERYLYLPAIGLWLIVADQVCVLYERSAFKRALIAIGASIMICLSVITLQRNGDWRDNIAFYTHMGKRNPDSALAHFSLGLAHWERDEIPQAQSEWKRTAEIDPRYFNVLAFLGQSYVRINSFEQAEYYYTKQIEVYPDDATAVYNLALIKEKLNKPGEALRYYERFITLRPQADADILATVNARMARLKYTAGLK